MAGDSEVRIGDAERRSVDQQLQRATGEGLLTLGEYDERSAVVWAARTRADLAEVVADLPTGVRPLEAVSGTAKARWGVAVMSEQRLSGPVLPGQHSHSVAVMGHGLIDLRRSDLPPVVNVSATAVMGAIEVLVPEGARVEANGIALMGSRDIKLVPPMPGAPLIRVHATAVMGHVEVRHKRLGRKDSRLDGMAHRLEGASSSPAGDVGLARSDRHLHPRGAYSAARRDRHRRGKTGIVAAVLILTAGGAVAAAATGDQVGGFGSQEVVVSGPPHQVKVAQFFGSAKVILPTGACASVTGTHIFGSVETHTPLCPSGQKPFAVVANGAFGSIAVQDVGYVEPPDTDDH